MGLIPGQGTKIPDATHRVAKLKKERENNANEVLLYCLFLACSVASAVSNSLRPYGV